MAKKSSVRQARYDATHIEQYSLKLHKVNDQDIIEAINKTNSSSKQGAIKQLIRKAIEND